MTLEQLALFPPEVQPRGADARTKAGLCSVETCNYAPVQIDRWGHTWCSLHRWQDTEMLAEGKPLQEEI